MIFLKVLSIICALLCLLLLLPVGGDISYREGLLQVYLRVWQRTWCVYPREAGKRRKKESAAETKDKSAQKSKKTFPDVTKDEIAEAIAVGLRALKKLRFRLHILKLHFVSAFPDPYRTAMVYGYAGAVVSALGLPQLPQADVQLGADFQEEACYFDGYLSVTIRIWYICKLAVSLLWGGIPILMRRRKRLKQQRSTAAQGKES